MVYFIIKHSSKAKSPENGSVKGFQDFLEQPILNCSNGDEGNRTPVRKPVGRNFYRYSQSFKIPLNYRRQTGYSLR